MNLKADFKKIKEQLEQSQNPIFFYDNDSDGLCSFLLLRRWIGRGVGVAIRSYPEINISYARKIDEYKADCSFILDKPFIDISFVKEIEKKAIPIVWIDHHKTETCNLNDSKDLYFFNWAEKYGEEKPVSYWTHKISEKKEDIWIALMGCIADHYLPEFVNDFIKEYPDLWGDVKTPFDAYFKTEIGKISMCLNFGLKDSTSNINRLQNFLINCKSPRDVLAELKENESFRKKCNEIKKKYERLVEEASKCIKNNLLFFEYSGEISMSADISNKLQYLYPEKYVVVAYKKGVMANLSLRGKNVKKIFLDVLKNFDKATGGGHDDAVGGRIKTEDLNKFKEELENKIQNKKHI